MRCVASLEAAFGRKRIKSHPGPVFVAPFHSSISDIPMHVGVDVCMINYANESSYMFGEGVTEVRGKCGSCFRS